MKTLFILMNHSLTKEQEKDAVKNLNIDNFVIISDEKWSNIDPTSKSVLSSIESYKNKLKENSKLGDVLLVQGDFGATYTMANFAKSIGLIPIYATTRRIVSEQLENGKLVIKREFKHERFREYE
ncbi:CRISPR-associated protein Csx20 [Campylobacter sp. RM16190]|uniref:CRISPR-associated protein Csx20 n=1 Tax=Campylobacter sp. RM16190 TaxID=1705727 RepID=UPI0014738896|nr:CRISPR-associated protein Csx20 [Campylobacter sp. RM16190]